MGTRVTVCKGQDLFMGALAKQVPSIFEGEDRSITFPTDQQIAWLGRTSHKDHLIETSRPHLTSEVADHIGKGMPLLATLRGL